MKICCGCLSIPQPGQSLLLCGRCLTAENCTRQCQRAHNHRAVCADMALQKLLVTVDAWAPSYGLEGVRDALRDEATELRESEVIPLKMTRVHVERMWALVRVVYENGVGKRTHGDGDMSMAPALYVATLNLVGQCVCKKRLSMEDRHEAFVDEVYKALCGEGSRINLSHIGAVRLAMLCGDLLESIGRNGDALEIGRRKFKLRAAKPYEYWKCRGDTCHCQVFRGIFEDWRHIHKRLLDLALSCQCLRVCKLMFAARCGLDIDSLVKGLEVARRTLRVIEEGADRCIQNRRMLDAAGHQHGSRIPAQAAARLGGGGHYRQHSAAA